MHLPTAAIEVIEMQCLLGLAKAILGGPASKAYIFANWFVGIGPSPTSLPANFPDFAAAMRVHDTIAPRRLLAKHG